MDNEPLQQPPQTPVPEPKPRKVWPVIVLVVVLAVAAGAYGYWLGMSGPGGPAQQNLQPQSTQTQHPAIEPDPQASLCAHNTIQEFGQVSQAKDILVYSTECILKVYPNNATDSLMRFYVRDAAGTFNRRLKTVLNTPALNGSTYAEVTGLRNNIIRIHRIQSGSDSLNLDVNGKDITNLGELEKDGNVSVFLPSPSGNFSAVGYFSDAGDKSKEIDIVNLKTGETKVSPGIDNGLNGVHPVAWSADEKTLYAAGGIWEFAAPAKLWKIDADSAKATPYTSLNGYDYPVTVFSEINLAFVLKNNEASFEDNPADKDISLYQIDLTSGKVSPFATEHAQYAFDNLRLIDGELYYDVKYQSDTGIQIKKINLQSNQASIVLNPGPNRAEQFIYSQAESWMGIFDPGEYKILYLKTGEQKEIGKASSEVGLRVPVDSTEYVNSLVGVIKAAK